MSTPDIPGTSGDLVPSKPTKSIQPGEEKLPQGGRTFASYMEGNEPNPLVGTGQTPSQLSPLDLSRGNVPASGPTFDTIQAQAKAAHVGLGEVAEQLNTPNLKLKQSSKYLLRNKLSAAKAHIQSANQKLGTKTVKDAKLPTGAGPLQKFIGLVTDGQNQLAAAQEQLKAMKKDGTEVSPGEMLMIQIKINKAQQEIEYSSILLSKAVDDIKMMMNIQL